MTKEEKNELAQLSRLDGKRFYSVVESLYKFLIVFNWVIGIGGVVFGISIIATMEGVFAFAGIFVIGLTALVCAANYALAVLTTHGAKVLVHLLFSNIAIMEAERL